MEKHKVLLGALYVIFGAFTVAGALFVIILVSLNGGVIINPVNFNDYLKLIGFLGSILLLLVSIPGIIGGIGLLNQRHWARNLILVVGIFYLFFIPLGTFLSMYTMLVLMRDQVALLFISSTSEVHKETIKKVQDLQITYSSHS
jgi:ABC-type multidrug transport system fused ATPase/permease subunit